MENSNENGNEPDWDQEDPFNPDEHYSGKKGDDEGGGYKTPPPPPGIHALVIEQWEWKQGKKGPYINMAFSVQAEGTPYHKYWIWDVLSLSDGAMGRWAAIFKALGWTQEYGTINRHDDNALKSWFDQGTIIYAKTKLETWERKRRAKVAFYIPADESPAAQSGPPGQAAPPQQPAPQNPNAHDDRPHGGAPGPGYGDVNDPFSSDFEQQDGQSPPGGSVADDDDMPF